MSDSPKNFPLCAKQMILYSYLSIPGNIFGGYVDSTNTN